MEKEEEEAFYKEEEECVVEFPPSLCHSDILSLTPYVIFLLSSFNSEVEVSTRARPQASSLSPMQHISGHHIAEYRSVAFHLQPHRFRRHAATQRISQLVLCLAAGGRKAELDAVVIGSGFAGLYASAGLSKQFNSVVRLCRPVIVCMCSLSLAAAEDMAAPCRLGCELTLQLGKMMVLCADPAGQGPCTRLHRTGQEQHCSAMGEAI